MLLSRHQNVDKNRDIKIANRSFENVSQFKYSGNASYHLVQNLLSFLLLLKNVKIRIYETTNLPVVLYGCETLSLLRITGLKWDELTREGRKLHNWALHDLYSSSI
jgi:hypothetical protein